MLGGRCGGEARLSSEALWRAHPTPTPRPPQCLPHGHAYPAQGSIAQIGEAGSQAVRMVWCFKGDNNWLLGAARDDGSYHAIVLVILCVLVGGDYAPGLGATGALPCDSWGRALARRRGLARGLLTPFTTPDELGPAGRV